MDLHELDPTGRFSDRAEDYWRYRPDYPAAAIDAILRGLGDPRRLTAADIGAGTGISARLLAGRGARVIAVEPNAEMRAAAEPHPRVEWLAASAEATGLEPASLDLLLAAQAFHWFRAREALLEFHRVLGPKGRLALMWNTRDRRDPLTRGYIEAICAVNGEDPAERLPLDPATIHEDGWFSPARAVTFDHGHALDRDGLVGRAMSDSSVPRRGAAFEEIRLRLEALFDRERGADGRVVMRYVTRLYLAERR